MVTKRFIAGAVCPRCAEQDRIRMYMENGKQFRECVNCGYQDEMRFQSAQRELDTRVNRTPEEKATEVQPVRLIDPKGEK